MTLKKRNLLGGINRFRLMLTLVLAVLLPAAELIYVNFAQLRSFDRDKFLQAAIHRDFQEALAITEKKMGKKAYGKVEEVMGLFPAAQDGDGRDEKLKNVLAKCSCFDHAFMFDGNDLTFQTPDAQLADRFVREEHDHLVESYSKWFSSKEELKYMADGISKKPQHIMSSPMEPKRADGPGYLLAAFFALPDSRPDDYAFGGVVFDPCYMKNTFFPEMLADSLNEKSKDETGNKLAMMIYRADGSEGSELKPIVATAGWDKGKPEVMRKMDDVFRGLGLAIKYQGVSVEALGQTWMRRSFMILGFLSVMMIGGLLLTKHMVSKEMGLAKLKSDFVSNVSHELRTPLALIRLYAETLELGRITTPEKKQQYYRIVRKESERLTALINNILDFSRIEAGHKEYEFRETDIADLVRNTLDSYRYQIEQQGFSFEEKIEDSVPPVRVDREAIARALVNLVNNALKYSGDEKYLGVKLYRENGLVKLEVADHGIGIARRDQAKIFEKFYRAGDPLVHNTKGSGLGLSLVRHITEAHGGAIEVESAPGTGSKFILSLPVAADLQSQQHTASASVEQQTI